MRPRPRPARLFLLSLLLATAGVTAPAPAPADVPLENSGGRARHEEKLRELAKAKPPLILIGDSITHTLQNYGGKYQDLTPVWDRHFGARGAVNLGFGGYRTENILWNLRNGQLDLPVSPKVAVVLIGTNNADDRRFPHAHGPEEILAGTRAIVAEIRKRHPSTHVVLVRLFPRGGDTEKGVSPPVFLSSTACIQTVLRAGELLTTLADDHVHCEDLNHVFLRPDGKINTDLMPDLLHPNAAGAAAWAAALEPTLAKWMGDTPVTTPSANNAVVPVSKLEQDGYDWFARHEAILKDRRRADVVMIGDSITHFWEERNGPSVWKELAGTNVVRNLGFGWDRTQNVLWRLDHGELDGLHPRRIVLLIGTNNLTGTPRCRASEPAEIVAGVREIVLRCRAKAPGARLTLMAVLPRWKAADARRARIAEVNAGLKALAEEAGETFLDIGPGLVDANGEIPREIMPDQTHPSPAGYAVWAKALREAGFP